MSSLQKLKEIQLVSKVTQEIEMNIGIRDKVIAEFIIHLCKNASSEEHFFQLIKENDANFPHHFVTHLFQIIKGGNNERKHLDQEAGQNNLSQNFPGLAIRNRSRSKSPDSLLKVNEIYSGRIRQVSYKYCIVDLPGKQQGKIQLSELPGNEKDARLVVSRGDRVKVKILKFPGRSRNEEKFITLTMKSIDQVSGQEMDELNPIFGALTGINVQTEEEQERKEKKLNDIDQWEATQLKHALVFDFQNSQEEDLVEQDLEIDVNEQEPIFLKGQTTKTSGKLSPIRIIKDQDGTLQKAAINQISIAKERRELKEAESRQIINHLKNDINTTWEDPQADNRTFASALRVNQKQKQEDYGGQSNNNKVPKSIQMQKDQLPISKLKDQLLQLIERNQIIIVVGETGSGKTTQITQYLVDAGYTKHKKMIGCTQPRRMAAVSVAKRVAEEVNCKLGTKVGYQIRFEDCTSSETIIKYMSDGILLREALLDSNLQSYNVIILDEAHERSVDTDVLFGILKQVTETRKDLKLIVTSATLDQQKFQEYFNDCPVFSIPGRTFPVEILYVKEPEADYFDATLITIMQIHLTEQAGDILVFLTGQEEIDNACLILNQRMKALGPQAPPLIVLPVYSAQPTEIQTRIFDPAPQGSRKCIIATNIAEASLTIDGIYFVVDPGFVKIKTYNPRNGMDQLIVSPISQASARQRAGRAGRTGPGKCFRLYTEQAYNTEMLSNTIPEIQRSNLANVVLVLKAMGINDLINFKFMDPPPTQSLIVALQTLYALAALDEEGLLTRLGRRMAEFPLDPLLSKMLLSSVDLGCSEEVLTIVGMLSVPNIFYRPKEKQNQADQKRANFNHPDGDHLTLLNVYESWKNHDFSVKWCFENFVQQRALKRALDIRNQLLEICERYNLQIRSCGSQLTKVRKAITAGFFMHACKKDAKEGYKSIVDSQQVYIHPSSAVFNKPPDYVVYFELVFTTKEYMRDVCAINPQWLIDVAPHFFKSGSKNVIQLSKKKKQDKIEPLFNRFEEPNAWRLSRRRG